MQKKKSAPGTKLADPGLRETDYIIHINTTIIIYWVAIASTFVQEVQIEG